MGADFKASASLEGIDDLSIPFSKGLRKAEKAAKRSFGRIERFGKRMRRGLAFVRGKQFLPGKQIKKFGTTARRAFGAVAKLGGATTAFGALAIDRFGKFELAVSRIGNLLTDDRDAVATFGEQLKRLSLQFGIPQIEAAEGAYLAFSGGIETTNKALAEFLPAAAKLAKAGKTDLPTAIDALTTFKEIFPEIDSTKVSDLLFVTERLGKTDAGQIAQSIGGIAGVAKAAGIPIEQILAMIASITKGGKSTSEAITQIGAIIKGIQQPAKELRKNFSKLAVPFGPLAIKQAGGLQQLLINISEISDAGALQKLFGRRNEAIQGATRLTQTGLKPMNETAIALSNSAKVAEKNWANMSRRTGFKVQQLKVGFSGLFTELGGGLAEGLGVGSADPADIAARFESAGKRVRSGAKNFAVGFVEALVPGGDLASLDFDAMAKSAGSSFGKMITGLGKITSFAIKAAEKIAAIGGTFLSLVNDIEGFIGGDSEVDRRQRELGLKEIVTEGEQGTLGTGAGADFLSAFTDVESLSGVDKKVQALRRAKFAAPLAGRTRSSIAGENVGRSVDPSRLISENPLLLFAEAAKRSQNAAQASPQQAVLIGLEGTVILKGEGAKAAKVNVKAKAKKGNAKVGKVGKRAVGT